MNRVQIDEKELREAWDKYETARRIAQVYGCHYNTILNKSREFGILLPPGPKSRANATKSQVSRFFARYKGVVPTSFKEVAELSGCSYAAVRNYAYRQRRLAKTLISSEPWRHNGRPVLWQDIRGAAVPDRAFDRVRAFISRWGSIRFEVRLKTGAVHVFKMSAGHFRRMYR